MFDDEGALRWGEVGHLAGVAGAGAVAAVTARALAGCGGEEEEGPSGLDAHAEETETVQVDDASPAAGTPGRGSPPPDVESGRVAITADGLGPGTVEAQAGVPFVLVVGGDGQPHTIAIEGLVTERPGAADAEIVIQVSTNAGSAGDTPSLLDGERAGPLRLQGAGGITDP